MSERRLRELLLDAPVPGQEEAERRGMLLVAEAYAGRPRTRRSPAPRLAIALAAALVLAALVLSPAGATVRHWVGDVFATTRTPAPAPALTEVPGGGRLLVQSGEGAWVVQPDGSRRLIGHYDETTWSPHGLFVGAAAGHSLSAVEPDGTAHWSISAPGLVRDPRWSPDGFRIAFRSGRSLPVVHADGTGDSLLAPRVAAAAPAWSPLGAHQLAFLDGSGRLRLLDTDTREVLGSAPALPGARALAWAPSGSPILEASPRALRTRAVAVDKLAGRFGLGPPRAVALPAGATVEAAAFSNRSSTIAAILALPAHGERPPHSELVLIDPAGGPPRRLLSVPGSLSDLLWSPDGSRLLVSWRDVDEWLFIPARGDSRGRAFGPISAEFAPGSTAAGAEFPRLEGWCCAQDASR
jgi:dipeptidyl aminopeptidase/acylaminoacyl peptidase